MPLFKSCKDGVHRYEARYDEVPNEHARGIETEWRGTDDLRAILYCRTYIHDICTRCGHVVKREGKKE